MAIFDKVNVHVEEAAESSIAIAHCIVKTSEMGGTKPTAHVWLATVAHFHSTDTYVLPIEVCGSVRN